MQPKNSIAIEDNGNITIQDVTNGSINIQANNPEEIVKEIKVIE